MARTSNVVKPQVRKALKVIAFLLLILGMVRALNVVLLEPLAAYANQAEMTRVSSCTGLWPVLDVETGPSMDTPPPQEPPARYARGEVIEESCYRSSETVVARMAATAHSFISGGGDLDARWLGLIKLAVLFLAAIIVQVSLRKEPFAATMHGLLFALVVCDPINLLFANSLNNDFSALLGVYMTFAAASATMLRGSFTIPLSFVWLVGLATLAGSSMQHLTLPLWLTLFSFMALRQRSGSILITSLIITGMLLFMQLGQKQKDGDLQKAHRADALFTTIMAAHPDPKYLAYRLGLGDDCSKLVNTSWQHPRGRNLEADCPAAFELSSARIAWVMVTEPVMSIRLYVRALHQVGVWRLPYLGERAGEDFGSLEGPGTWSISAVTENMSFGFYVLFFSLPLWAGLAAGVWLFSSRHAEHPPMRSLMLGQCLLALLIILILFSTILGVGFEEFARRARLAQNAAAVAWLLMPCLIISIWRQDRFYRLTIFQARSLVMLSGIIWVLLFSFIFPPRLELGFGSLSMPETEQTPGEEVALEGWVLEPNGIAMVEAVTGDGRRVRLRTAGDAELQRLYPVGAVPQRFNGAVTLGDSQAGRIVNIVVTSPGGIETIIDRRWMVIEPVTTEEVTGSDPEEPDS